MLSAPATVYHPRNSRSSDYYRCVEDPFETFVQIYEERFERTYGFWRSHLRKVIDRYLECGDLYPGFPRLKCRDCQEYAMDNARHNPRAGRRAGCRCSQAV
jgi:hypothetical protein